MEIPDKVVKITLLVFVALLLSAVIIVGVVKKVNDDKVIELQNQIASKDTTIETQKGLYEKLSLQSDDLKDLLDKSDAQNKTLIKALEANREELLTANSLVIKWKHAYEAEVAGHQTEIPPVNPGGVARKKVEFDKDFGYLVVHGYTLTDPPQAYINVSQGRPLKLTIAVSQDKNGVWRSRTTSSEENMQVEIALASVNPFMLESRWYENIGVGADLAGGQAGTGFGILAGVGASYKIGKFEVGPHVWIGISDRIDKYLGVQFIWHPFAR